MIKIIVDSTQNLSDDYLAKHDIRVAPIAIQFGEESYQEDIDIDRDMFYSKIEELGIIPKTSQPTPAAYAEFYRELSQEGHQILVIAITSKHSGTYDSATLAKTMVPEADVEVFDSKSISLGTGWMVVEAVEGVEAGRTRKQIIDRLAWIRENSYLVITPATLKYLQMSGRVGALKGALASLLNVNPIIYLEDGALEAQESIRTRGKSIDRLFEYMKEKIGITDPVNMAVIHARAPDEGHAMVDRVKLEFNLNELLVEDLVASLAVHGGPGILGLFGYRV
ncbi:MAG TPA: DegV family protein [Anaerolineae bacterium]|nr:DegV family protein [Anaerolineae bacterium]